MLGCKTQSCWKLSNDGRNVSANQEPRKTSAPAEIRINIPEKCCNMFNKKREKNRMLHICIDVWSVVDVLPLTITMKDGQICGTETGSLLHISSEDLWGEWKVEITCAGNRMRLSVRRAYFTQWDGQPSKARIISARCFPCVLKGVSRGFLCRKAALQCLHPLFANQPDFAERDPGCTETTLSSRRPENPSAVTQEALETRGRWKLG